MHKARNEELKLVRPTRDLAESWYGDEEIGAYLEQCRKFDRGDVPEGFVPQTAYWLVRGDTILGGFRLRHRLSERLWQSGGHIGYDVRPEERNRGYATRMLAMALEKARARGLTWVLLTVDPENTPSIRVIEKNGGKYIGTADKSGFRRYRIDL